MRGRSTETAIFITFQKNYFKMNRSLTNTVHKEFDTLSALPLRNCHADDGRKIVTAEQGIAEPVKSLNKMS